MISFLSLSRPQKALSWSRPADACVWRQILVQQTIAILEDCEDAKRKRYFEELKDGEKTFVARLPRLRPCIDTDDPDE